MFFLKREETGIVLHFGGHKSVFEMSLLKGKQRLLCLFSTQEENGGSEKETKCSSNHLKLKATMRKAGKMGIK